MSGEGSSLERGEGRLDKKRTMKIGEWQMMNVLCCGAASNADKMADAFGCMESSEGAQVSETCIHATEHEQLYL